MDSVLCCCCEPLSPGLNEVLNLVHVGITMYRFIQQDSNDRLGLTQGCVPNVNRSTVWSTTAKRGHWWKHFEHDRTNCRWFLHSWKPYYRDMVKFWSDRGDERRNRGILRRIQKATLHDHRKIAPKVNKNPDVTKQENGTKTTQTKEQNQDSKSTQGTRVRFRWQ